MFDADNRPFRIVSFHDDQATEERGSLIPRPKMVPAHRPPQALVPIHAVPVWPIVGTFAVGFAALVLMVLGTAGYGLVASNNLASAPSITIVDSFGKNSTALSYGPQPALGAVSFFVDTRDAFIDQGLTFIEVDIGAMQLRYFKRGVLLQSAEVLAVGEPGSWWSVPAGVYKVESLEREPFSTLAQVYLPFQLRFGGNYVIHGAPALPGGEPLQSETSVGGIRLENAAAEVLYQAAHMDIPVLVHVPPVTPDSFVYEPVAPEVGAAHYLIADVSNGTILAASTLDTGAPIASITKLMTAVVAAESIDLDTRVRASAPSFIPSLVPRLADRTSVSVYSLMQLLLVESSNEAAEVIAALPGRDSFIADMNTKARQLGMVNTTFTDPSGLDAGNVSTVGDLYKLVRYIYDNRSFIFEITNRAKVPVQYSGDEFADLQNFNRIEDIDSFIGGKVGETEAAGQTSVSLHEVQIQGERRVVMVVLLGSSARSDDVRSLLSYVESRFRSN